MQTMMMPIDAILFTGPADASGMPEISHPDFTNEVPSTGFCRRVGVAGRVARPITSEDRK